MKKTKLLNRLLLLLIATTLTLNSCSNEEYEGNFNSNENQTFQGIEITEDIAKEVALNFYNRTYRSGGELARNEQQTSRVESTEIIKDFNDDTGIYIVNIEPEGFVLVTSNSKNVPIAAHSETGNFELNENSPDGLKSWIAENIIFNDMLETREPIEEIDKQWYYLSEGRMPYPGDGEGNGESPNHTVRYSHTVNEQIGPLMQTTWRQSYPYSYYTPNNNPTGCVAVAMAQIMRYHEWPNTFNWSIMPNYSTFTGTPSSGSLEVASLMYDIGTNVNMQYSEIESGAYSEDALYALVNNYGYSSTANYSDYNFSTVKQEIKMYNRPVYMDGFHAYDTETTGWWFWEDTDITYTIGHAWVSDGYKQQYDVYIHNEGTVYEYTQQENRYEWLYMNWGWGLNYGGNGWFYKNFINNNGTTINVDGIEVNPNFQYKRRCIYSIKK